jgi:hypothetical protein
VGKTRHSRAVKRKVHLSGGVGRTGGVALVEGWPEWGLDRRPAAGVQERQVKFLHSQSHAIFRGGDSRYSAGVTIGEITSHRRCAGFCGGLMDRWLVVVGALQPHPCESSPMSGRLLAPPGGDLLPLLKRSVVRSCVSIRTPRPVPAKGTLGGRGSRPRPTNSSGRGRCPGSSWRRGEGERFWVGGMRKEASGRGPRRHPCNCIDGRVKGEGAWKGVGVFVYRLR